MAINNFNVGVGTTSQLTRYRYVATGGETSISGTDADGKTLSYTVGLEQVFLNGVNLVRGQDYTATNGTSIGSLTALVASDSLEVFAYVPFNIANALTVSTVDAKGDLLVGTGADAVGRLAVGTANQLLAVDSSTATGLKWANPGMTLINTTTFSGVTSVSAPSDTFTSTYANYRILFDLTSVSADEAFHCRLRSGGVDDSAANYNHAFYQYDVNNSAAGLAANTNLNRWIIGELDAGTNNHSYSLSMDIFRPKESVFTTMSMQAQFVKTTGALTSVFGGAWKSATTSFDSITFYASTNIAGKLSVYGYN
jgi:hypothetical protein